MCCNTCCAVLQLKATDDDLGVMYSNNWGAFSNSLRYGATLGLVAVRAHNVAAECLSVPPSNFWLCILAHRSPGHSTVLHKALHIPQAHCRLMVLVAARPPGSVVLGACHLMPECCCIVCCAPDYCPAGPHLHLQQGVWYTQVRRTDQAGSSCQHRGLNSCLRASSATRIVAAGQPPLLCTCSLFKQL